MKEALIAAGAKRWLQGRGFEVYGEVEPLHGGCRFDLVGKRGDELVIVESKGSLSEELRHQLHRASLCTERVWAAIPWRSRPLPARDSEPWGVLFVNEHDAFEARRPLPSSKVHEPHRAGVLGALTRWHLAQEGGLTSAEGGGKLSAYRALVFEMHLRLWRATERGRRGLQVGEVVDLCGELFVRVKHVRGAVLRCLRRERAFFFDSRRGGWVPTGFEVPDDAAPGRKKRDPWKTGREARRLGAMFTSCPYPRLSAEADRWHDGWRFENAMQPKAPSWYEEGGFL